MEVFSICCSLGEEMGVALSNVKMLLLAPGVGLLAPGVG